MSPADRYQARLGLLLVTCAALLSGYCFGR